MKYTILIAQDHPSYMREVIILDRLVEYPLSYLEAFAHL